MIPVRESVVIHSSPATVWACLSQPDHLANWFADAVEGNVQSGGKLTLRFHGFDFEAVYAVRQADPGQHLSLESQTPVGSVARDEFVLSPADSGGTRVTMIHSSDLEGPDWADHIESVGSGWRMALAILKFYAEHNLGRGRSAFFVTRQARFEYATLQPYFRQSKLLLLWLADAGQIGGEGERYELRLKNQSTMSGEVLADSGRELALEWREGNGIVELKAFPMGPEQRAVAIRACSWNLNETELLPTKTYYSESLDRLVGALPTN
jgi:uncharacterized protein YndB with AHSA1/START domain